ncbi:MAG: hypothetical protein WDN72_08535 [Alphaproteobacteria bacterium]
MKDANATIDPKTGKDTHIPSLADFLSDKTIFALLTKKPDTARALLSPTTRKNASRLAWTTTSPSPSTPKSCAARSSTGRKVERHCEEAEPTRQSSRCHGQILDCFVAMLLAMTGIFRLRAGLP